jgi:riboflavin kinase/FMN adenylyltransferase
MQVHFGVDMLEPEWSGAVLCIGTFDGVHLGHQAVIRRAVEVGASEGLPVVLLTFDRHPAHVLAPERCPKAVASLDENLTQFSRIGVQVALVLAFTRELSQTSADEFFQLVMVDHVRAKKIVVGHDFAFGKDRQGTPEWLAERIDTEVVPPFMLEGSRVSSSAVRSEVAQGRVEHAGVLLGRPFAIAGVVVSGQRLGRELGYPTINLARSFDQVTPADGVYSGFCQTPHGTYRAAVSIGMRPAVAGTHRTIEAYLIDYPGNDLYGKGVSLSLEKRLREERDFDSLEALKEQIAKDVAQASLS